jgi:hypothetical protein
MDVTQTLGQRIVEAARLAAAAHLHAALADVASFRQRVVIGGAGPVVVMGNPSGALPAPDAQTVDDADPITDESLPESTPGRSIRPGTTVDGGAT